VKGFAPDIPDKVYFRMSEVSRLVGVDPHVLRYWETEFALIKPFRSKSKQRLYRRQDVENLLQIKKLLHDDGYTIAGARKYLKNTGNQQQNTLVSDTKILPMIKNELYEILLLMHGVKKDES
jgi:DNA-binding transcriptional MerR regulator